MAVLDFLGKWRDKVADYIDTRIRIVKLDITERIARVLSFFTFTILILLLLMPAFLFTGMGLAELFSDLLGSRTGGYFVMAGVYTLALLILYACRKTLIRKFTGLFIGVLTDSGEGDEEDKQQSASS
ncbi:MAG: hypothetical protein JST82_10490 [Bacteroidetes bacterium]|nr:hypothetical protein [Bacteroidota bacterium]